MSALRKSKRSTWMTASGQRPSEPPTPERRESPSVTLRLLLRRHPERQDRTLSCVDRRTTSTALPLLKCDGPVDMVFVAAYNPTMHQAGAVGSFFNIGGTYAC